MNFEQLVYKVTPKLKGIAHRLNGRFTFFNEEDLYQEAVVHLWNDFKEGKLDNKTDSYVLQGCYFYLKNYIRKTQDGVSLVRLSMEPEEGGELNLENLVSLRCPSTEFEDLRQRIFVEDIQQNSLTEREGCVLSLCLEGLTAREIGQKLGISHVMVVKIKNRIREKCIKFRRFL